jgi:pyruvate,water dikinase
MTRLKLVRFFDEIGIEDVPSVGGKNASLGEMYRELSSDDVLVPNGFAITAEAYHHMLDMGGAVRPLREALAGLDEADVADLARRGKRAGEIVYGAGLPDDLVEQILAGYRRLQGEYGEEVSQPRGARGD